MVKRKERSDRVVVDFASLLLESLDDYESFRSLVVIEPNRRANVSNIAIGRVYADTPDTAPLPILSKTPRIPLHDLKS